MKQAELYTGPVKITADLLIKKYGQRILDIERWTKTMTILRLFNKDYEILIKSVPDSYIVTMFYCGHVAESSIRVEKTDLEITNEQS